MASGPLGAGPLSLATGSCFRISALTQPSPKGKMRPCPGARFREIGPQPTAREEKKKTVEGRSDGEWEQLDRGLETVVRPTLFGLEPPLFEFWRSPP